MGLKLNTASGGSVSIEPTNTASNYTLTVPAQTGTVIASDSSGNLGLGVTPSAWSSAYKAIQIGRASLAKNTGNDMLLLNNAYNGSGGWTYIESAAAQLYLQGSGQHIWYTAPSGTAGNAISFTQAMTLDSSGNLLVGVTSASASGPRVYAVNNNNVSGDTGIFSQLGSNCSNTSSAAFSALITGVGNKFYVYGNGNVVNTNNSYGAISDIKFKENISDATPKLDDVLKLKVRNFNLKTEPNNKQIGFIAQEFEEVFPKLIDVSPDSDENGQTLETTHKSIKLSVLVPILVKAIQELKAELDTVKTELATLKGTA